MAIGLLAVLGCVETARPVDRSCAFSSDCQPSEVCAEGRCVVRSMCAGSSCATGELTGGSGQRATSDAGSSGQPGLPRIGGNGASDAASPEVGANETDPGDGGGSMPEASVPPIDASVPLLAEGATCTKDQDCASSLCYDFGAGAGLRCTDSCGKSADCPSGFTCVFVNGAKLCAGVPVVSGTLSAATGGTCASDGDCRSNMCFNGICVETCTKELDCPSGASCGWIEGAQTTYRESCLGPLGQQTAGNGCNVPSDCASGVCYDDNNSGRCGLLCDSSAACAANEICAPVDFSVCLSGGSTCQSWRVQTVKSCLRSAHGSGVVGASCTSGGDCRSAFCEPTIGQCVDTCSTNADCPSTHRCKVAPAFSLDANTTVDVNVCMPM
jgi:hypothetical protein